MSITESSAIPAWHFLQDDGSLSRDGGHHGAEQKPRVGDVLHVEPPLELCSRGLHASRSILDALAYASGSFVCRVSLWGEVSEDDDKLVAEFRRIDWMLDTTNVLHEFGCRQAEQALALVKNPDPRSVAAIQAKRNWLAGKITEWELAAARDAARGSARDAARDAAWGAARDAAWGAARAAARGAARDAAWAAARDAARGAAWDAAWDAAGKQLVEMIEEARV